MIETIEINKVLIRNDMQLLEDFCLSEHYHFNESFEQVTEEEQSYLVHSIQFKSFGSIQNWLKSLVFKIADSVIEEKQKMSKRSIMSLSIADEDLVEQGERMMDRVACGLPLDFGTHHSVLTSSTPLKKAKVKPKKQKSSIQFEDIENEMVLQFLYNQQWIPCYVVDMEVPKEEELVTIHNYLVQPILSSSNSSLLSEFEELEDPILLQPNEIDFLSSKQVASLLENSLQPSKRFCYLHLQIIESNEVIAPQNLPSSLRKYYNQRYVLFSRWDRGIQFDEEGLFSVTPEALALHTAIRCSCNIVIDAFAGIGGNSIQLARTCNRVIAIDLNMTRLKMLYRNSCIYNVQKKIELVCGDSTQLLPQMKADVVVLAPPWGGVSYNKKEVFRLEDLPAGLDGRMLFQLARKITKNVVFILPRNIDRKQVASLGEPGELVELVEGKIEGSIKMIIAYFGNLAQANSNVHLLLFLVS